jgi:hypothetical protein
MMHFIVSLLLPLAMATETQGCGDDLLCYFSDQEIEAAYGMPASEVRRQGLTSPIDGENFDRPANSLPPQWIENWPFKASDAPVYAPFVAAFRSCASGCVPGVYGTYGTRYDQYGNPKFSCHNGGRALDLMNFVCGGTRYNAFSAKYRQMVACVRPKMKKILYGDAAHKDHAHFSLGCRHPNGTGWW